ncbi:MAG: alanine--glyoxylate aminotransferase family protein, partial [Chloroflexi bacterium]|nr:alanine--glyoxylate aminotransferase family protein [Chloroflexota bacterium]
AHDAGALFMVDCVTSLGGAHIDLDGWGIDYAYSAPQKCLAGPPGVSLVAVGDRVLDAIRRRKRPPTSWCLDLGLIADYWGPEHKHHHTSPIPLIFGVREALAMALEEGVEQRILRHARVAEALRAGISALGLALPIPQDCRLNQLTVVAVPAGVDDQKVRQQLLDDYGIEIGRGLGQFQGKVWRIGLMGESAQPQNVLALLAALERVLPVHGYEVGVGAGVAAASAALSREPVRVP